MEESEVLLVSVRGMEFEIPLEFIQLHQEAPLTKAFLDRGDVLTQNDEPPLYLDKDPFLFAQVVGFFDAGEIHLCAGTCAEILRRELTYFGLDAKAIALCCRMHYLEQCEKRADLVKFMRDTDRSKKCRCKNHCQVGAAGGGGASLPSTRSRRQMIWHALEELTDIRAKVYYFTILAINVISVLMMVLSTLPSCRVRIGASSFERLIMSEETQRRFSRQFDIRSSNSSRTPTQTEILNSTVPHEILFMTELACALILTVDLILNFVTCPRRLDFLFNLLNIVGIFSLLIIWATFALYLAFLLEVTDWESTIEVIHILECLRFLRIFYIFHSLHHYRPLNVIILSIRYSLNELALLFLLVGVGTLVYGSVFYLVEMHVDTAWSIPEGVWWAVITMTTVGYGDIRPHSPLGKVVGILCAVSGILVIALPVPIISSNFGKYYQLYKMSDRMRKWKNSPSKAPSRDFPNGK